MNEDCETLALTFILLTGIGIVDGFPSITCHVQDNIADGNGFMGIICQGKASVIVSANSCAFNGHAGIGVQVNSGYQAC